MNLTDIKSQISKAIELFKQGQLEASKQLALQLLKNNPKEIAAIHILAKIAYKEKQYSLCVEYLSRAIGFDSKNGELYYQLGCVLREMGQIQQSLNAFNRALSLNPEDIKSIYRVGSYFFEQEEYQRSIPYFTHILKKDPMLVSNLQALGMAYLRLNQLELAEHYIKKALEISPDNAELVYQLACCFYIQGQVTQAATYLAHKKDKLSDNFNVFIMLGTCYLELGEKEKAILYFQKSMLIEPQAVLPLRLITLCKRYDLRNDPDIEKIKKLLNDKKISTKDQIDLFYALGKIDDDIGECQAAFLSYEKGHELQRQTRFYSPKKDIEKNEKMMAMFQPAIFKKMADQIAGDECLALIVGLPRSGKSLVQKIIAAHPAGISVDELSLPNDIVMFYPELLTYFDIEKLKLCKTEIWQSVSANAHDKTQVIANALSDNAFYIGLYRMIFLNLRIIYCKRDPLDLALQCYFKHFGFSNDYTHRLEHLAIRYREYVRLMEFWKKSCQ